MREILVHPANGEFVVAKGDFWLPGAYATASGARRAAENLSYDALAALQNRKNAEADGAGGTITDADINLALAEQEKGRG